MKRYVLTALPWPAVLSACAAPAIPEEPPTLVAQLSNAITSIAVDTADVYVASGGPAPGGPIHRIAKAGGAPRLYGAADEWAFTIQLDGSALYWVDDTTKQLSFASKDGRDVVRAAGGHPWPLALSSDVDAVYFTARPADREAVGSVWRMNKVDGTFVELAANQERPGPLAVDATDIYWIDAGTDESSSLVMRGDKRAPSDPVVVARGLRDPRALALDQRFLYVSVGDPDDPSAGSVLRVSKAGGSLAVLAAAESPSEIVVDGNAVYVATTRGVLEIVPDAGTATALGLGPTERLAVDDRFVYFDWRGSVFRSSR